MIIRAPRSRTKTAAALSVALVAVGAGSVGLAARARPAELGDHLMVFVSPTEKTERAARSGDVQALTQVPFTITSHSGARYRLAIDPRQVPAGNIGKAGLVNFEVQRFTDDGSVGSTGFSLRRNPGSSAEWTDPANATTSASPDGFRTVSVDLPLTRVTDQAYDGKRFGRYTGDPQRLGQAIDPSKWKNFVGGKVSATPPAASARTASGAATCTLKGTRDVWTTVATSYPAQGEKSWLNFSSGMSTTTGKAATTTLAGKFRAEGTKSTSDGWGQDFAPSTANRAYFISIMYGLYQCWNTITGFSWYKTEPLYQTGGTKTQKIAASDRPKWTRCRPISNGTWWRGKQKGQNYTLSYGVRIRDAIGIDLYSQHGYSQSGRLNFTAHHSNKRMCGEKVYPAVAPKLVERLR